MLDLMHPREFKKFLVHILYLQSNGGHLYQNREQIVFEFHEGYQPEIRYYLDLDEEDPGEIIEFCRNIETMYFNTVEEEEKERVRKAVAKKALEKLTPEERRALGV